MSTVTLCVYCEQLPTQAQSGAARVSRCPLCHAAIGCTSAGDKFRVVETTSGALGRGPRHLLVLAIGAILATGAVVAALLSRTPSTNDVPVTAVPSQIAIVADASHSVTPLPEPVVTPSAPGAAAKPYIGSSRYLRRVAKISPYPVKVEAHVPLPNASVLGDNKASPGSGSSYDLTLMNDLANVPEVALHDRFSKSLPKSEVRERTTKSAKEILETNQQGKEQDAFVRKLMDTRSDLEGLPFLLGKACRLESKAASRLAVAAALVRSAESSYRSSTRNGNPDAYPFNDFWYLWSNPGAFREMARRVPSASVNVMNKDEIDATHMKTGIGALNQILSGEDARTRRGLVLNLATQEHADAAKVLAKFAVFDPDHDVRDLAVTGLRQRRPSEYSSELVAAVRYPWAPAARHAAEALVRNDVKEAIPSLIDFLDEPDPSGPIVLERKGEKAFAIRELVRINHNRNCQLCHAPADRADRSDPGQVLASVPSPVDPLPPTLSVVYYRSRGSLDVFVRADTTYLRQDFSALLSVPDPDPWPEKQRFDFLIRTRVLDNEEAAERLKKSEPKCSSPQHEAALAALRRLTGHDLGPSAAVWRRQNGDTTQARGASKPAW